MGCCSSKSEDARRNNSVASPFSPTAEITNQQVPPIVITKAQSVASVESLHASSSAKAINKPEENLTESEKPQVIIEEQTQEHQYGEPPAFEEQAAANPKAVIKDTKPVMIVTPRSESDPAIIPAPESMPADSTSPTVLPEVNTSSEVTAPTDLASLCTIFVRLSTSGAKDIAIEIPTQPPFMTVSELKNKINIPADQQIKLIHMGRILKDDFDLVPASTTSTTTTKSETIKVPDQGVIQAMVYRN